MRQFGYKPEERENLEWKEGLFFLFTSGASSHEKKKPTPCASQSFETTAVAMTTSANKNQMIPSGNPYYVI